MSAIAEMAFEADEDLAHGLQFLPSGSLDQISEGLNQSGSATTASFPVRPLLSGFWVGTWKKRNPFQVESEPIQRGVASYVHHRIYSTESDEALARPVSPRQMTVASDASLLERCYSDMVGLTERLRGRLKTEELLEFYSLKGALIHALSSLTLHSGYKRGYLTADDSISLAFERDDHRHVLDFYLGGDIVLYTRSANDSVVREGNARRLEDFLRIIEPKSC